MTVKLLCTAAAALALAACGGEEQMDEPAKIVDAGGAPRLEQEWLLEGGLSNPESVALGPDGQLYVTNVAGEGEAKDGNGYISVVATDGAMRTPRWTTGLNAPKGIALHDGVFYVADIDEIVVIDAATGAVRAKHHAPGAQFLNDVAVLADETVLVADSGGAKLFALKYGRVTVWLENPLLEALNGILVEQDRLVVTTMAGRLLAIDLRTKAITTLAEGLGDADGVARAGEGYLVSEWPGVMHYVRDGGIKSTLIDQRARRIFLNDFLRAGDMLYQPNWEPSTLTAYRIID